MEIQIFKAARLYLDPVSYTAAETAPFMQGECEELIRRLEKDSQLME